MLPVLLICLLITVATNNKAMTSSARTTGLIKAIAFRYHFFTFGKHVFSSLVDQAQNFKQGI